MTAAAGLAHATSRALAIMAHDPFTPDLRGFPPHLREGEKMPLAWLLRRWANGLFTVYGSPIYLCGSALRPDNPDPRDWDIRVRVSAAEWLVRFGESAALWVEQGDTGQWTTGRWRWSAECTKRAREGGRHTHLNIDFQCYPACYWQKFKDQPRVRIDAAHLRGRGPK